MRREIERKDFFGSQLMVWAEANMYKTTESEVQADEGYNDLWLNYVENYKIIMTMTAAEYDADMKPAKASR